MITSIIRSVIRFRVAVWLLVAAGVIVSAYAAGTTALDAIPDISDPQIVVYVKWPRGRRGAATYRRIPSRAAAPRTWGTRSSPRFSTNRRAVKKFNRWCWIG